jgi:hypothetical protein
VNIENKEANVKIVEDQKYVNIADEKVCAENAVVHQYVNIDGTKIIVKNVDQVSVFKEAILQ